MNATLVRSTAAVGALQQESRGRPHQVVESITVRGIATLSLIRSGTDRSGTDRIVMLEGHPLGTAVEDGDYRTQRTVTSMRISDGTEYWYIFPEVPVRGKRFKLNDWQIFLPATVRGWMERDGKYSILESLLTFYSHLPGQHSVVSSVIYTDEELDDTKWGPLSIGAPLSYQFPFCFVNHRDTGDPIISDGVTWLLRHRRCDYSFLPHTLDKMGGLARQLLERRLSRERYERFINRLQGKYCDYSLSLSSLDRVVQSRQFPNSHSEVTRNRITDVFDNFNGFKHQTVILPGTTLTAEQISFGDRNLWLPLDPDSAVYLFSSEENAVEWALRRIDYTAARRLAIYFTPRSESWRDRVHSKILDFLQQPS